MYAYIYIWVQIFAVLISKFQFFSCRTESAKKESVDSVAELLSADDLDQMESPEMVLLSAVSGEDAQDRSDRKILMPWVKFLWESYCQCLELLRTNVRVERLYHDIAQQAFRFCLKYQVRLIILISRFKVSLSYHLCVEYFSQFLFDSEMYT